MTTRAIGERCGVSHMSVRRWLRVCGIPVRAKGRGLANRGLTAPAADVLRRLIHVEHQPLRVIGTTFGVDMGTVRAWLRDYGIPSPTVWGTRRKGQEPALPGADELRCLYVDEELSLLAISRRFGVSADVITRLCREYGIPFRHDAGWNAGHRYACRDEHQVRSVYEMRVDDWLHDNGIVHAYEPVLAFDRRCRADFLANGWYVEIWGVTGRDDYTARRARKVDAYRLSGMALIELTHHDFTSKARGRWKRKLARCLSPVTSMLL